MKTKEKIELLFVGDLSSRGRTEERVMQGKTKNIFEKILPILKKKDLSIVNLENPLSERGIPILKTGPTIKGKPENVELLKECQFDVATLANNHMGDYGNLAIKDTLTILNQNNIFSVGAGMNKKEAEKILTMEKKGYKVAILNYAENETGIATRKNAGVAPIDIFSNLEAIQSAKKNHDIVVVCTHAGNEFNPFPRPQIVKMYRAFIKAGASVVVGTHPHCPQGFEIFEGKPIIYSLGNFLFDTNNSERGSQESMWWRSHMVKVVFMESELVDIQIIPYMFGPDASAIQCLSDRQSIKYQQYLDNISNVIKNEEELEKYWFAWCDMHGNSFVKHFLTGLEDGLKSIEDKPEKIVYDAAHIFSCEAHRDLMTCFLKRSVSKETGNLKSYEEKIKKYQKGE